MFTDWEKWKANVIHLGQNGFLHISRFVLVKLLRPIRARLQFTKTCVKPKEWFYDMKPRIRV